MASNNRRLLVKIFAFVNNLNMISVCILVKFRILSEINL